MSRFEKIKQEARLMNEQIVAWRRHFHAYPEIGHDVPQTEAYLGQELEAMGLQVRTGVGGHGVVAVLRGASAGKTIAVRADMDALMIQEETGLPFASRIEGRMHACGHDAHMAMALGTARLLSSSRGELAGNVKFLFQPAEEGPGGAKPMIDDGALEDPQVDAVIGLHTGCVWNAERPGEVQVAYGPMMACLDRIDVKIRGQGAHGAMPHRSVDPVSIAAHAISVLQTIISREINPLEPAVITIGKIAGGTAYNIIPDEVRFEGTVRALSQDLRGFLERRIGEILQNVVQGMRGECEHRYTRGYPPLSNDPDFTRRFEAVAKQVVGDDMVRHIPEPSMGGEDMAFFLQAVPGTFFFLAGSNKEKGQVAPHHNSRFDIDEDLLWVGTALEAAAVMDYLS